MLRLENQPLEQTDNEQHDDIDWRQNGEDSDAEDGGAGAEDELGEYTISKELLEREKQYHRLNRELQLKSAEVVKKVQNVVKEGKEAVQKPYSKVMEEIEEKKEASLEFPKKSAGIKKSTTAKIPSSARKTNPGPNVAKPRVKAPIKGSTETVFAEDDEDLELINRRSIVIDDAELKNQPIVGLPGDVTEEQLGTEATSRFLSAKVQVLQQEVQRLLSESTVKDSTISVLEEKLRSNDDEKAKMLKNAQNLNLSLEKSRKSNEDLKRKTEDLEAIVSSLRKDMEVVSRSHKQVEVDNNARDVRLNRALEDVEKYKAIIAKNNQESKEKMDMAKKNADKLITENKRLEKQKVELLAAFKKQMQLIDVLKRQKIHIEAAKVLQFTEDEFMKALNWDA